jgi:hypothetical protein
MKPLLIIAIFAIVAGLSASQPAEAKRHHGGHEKHDNDGRVYLSSRDVIYVHGLPCHRYSRAPVYVIRNRYGDPISYYVMNEYRDDYDDERYYEDRYPYRGNRYRYHDRNGITIIYRR